MPTATVTSKGQITIPKVIRDWLRLRSGDRLSFETGDDGRVSLQTKTRRIEELKGMLPRPHQVLSDEELDEAIGWAVIERNVRST